MKLTYRDVGDDPRRCGANETGWESAFSLYRPLAGGGAGRKLAGGTWNGVATFCRSGLIAAAMPDAFGEPEFDCEGRCLVTDHARFYLVNVYCPTNGDFR